MSVITSAPSTVTLTFNEPVTVPPDALTVTGPGTTTWRLGAPQVAGTVVTAPVAAVGSAGPSLLRYRVRSGDGDLVAGQVPFTLRGAPAAAPGGGAEASPRPSAPVPQSAPAASTNDGASGWVWGVGVAVVVALAAGASASVRRSRRLRP